MAPVIDIADLRTASYDKNEWRNENPCMICGKDVTKVEEKLESMADAIDKRDKKAIKWFNDNYIQMSTDGHLYFAYEDVNEGEESQGCFAIGCGCMKRYKQLRATLSK